MEQVDDARVKRGEGGSSQGSFTEEPDIGQRQTWPGLSLYNHICTILDSPTPQIPRCPVRPDPTVAGAQTLPHHASP